jgi:hypothetical protein
MLVLRLSILFLISIASILLGCYLIVGDQKYLYYFKQTLKLSLYLAVFIGIISIVYALF